ncbi:metal-dependent hydrolase family protein [Shewanella psychrotolerans]|uniref:metal-dependent hydrolase family protein n=1 Tax=Shewanella psychrotolerans TaxID=2864206 RepID=UPI001C658196|nr:amidohydrolase family protein [Shewanella psychrotolerans]QYK01634.1 amidohydrolase family protein [Shewanella psychrotolerans]
MKRFLVNIASLTLLLSSSALFAQNESEVTLFTNVNVFDGVHENLIQNANVVVTGNRITEISTEPLAVAGGKVIDGGGRTLMPGLTDAHFHIMHAHIASRQILVNDLGYLTLAGAEAAEATLMRGFTTVRDLGGPVFGIKKMIDEGRYLGPRIYASGAYISQTSGHGDMRFPTSIPRKEGRELLDAEIMAWTSIADGVPQVQRRVRENLMRGATQIKVMAGGGVASFSDPLDVMQYTYEEMKAAVDTAATWNTYVTVHAYSDNAVRGALEAGVQCIDHGQMMTEATAKLIKKKDAWLSLQPLLNDEDRIVFPEGSFEQQKMLAMTSGTEKAYDLAKKYDLKVAFGTDLQNGPEIAAKQGKALTKLTRWYEPWEVLKMATSTNYKLFKMSGPRDPYPGENGVIKKGALADILLVDGNPLKDIKLIADPEKNFVVIMKDGKIYKNTLN